MPTLLANASAPLEFVLVDDTGAEVVDLDDAFTVQISKDGGAFVEGVGAKAEIGLGWYSYEITAGETDTTGPLAVVVTAVGAVQLNLLYSVTTTGLEPVAGDNILTAAQAANVLRIAVDDARMLDLLPQIDAYIKRATGRDWAADAIIHPLAVSAATMLLVKLFEDPGQLGSGDSLHFGLDAALTQLEAEALSYRKMPEFYGRSGAGAITLPGALIGDSVVKLVGLYGVTGSQASDFESTISVAGQIQQSAASDLSTKIYLAFLKSPAEDVTA